MRKKKSETKNSQKELATQAFTSNQHKNPTESNNLNDKAPNKYLETRHYQEELITHIFLSTEKKQSADSWTEEAAHQKLLQLCVQHFKEWNFDSPYQKRFSFLKKPDVQALLSSASYRLYQGFLCELVEKVYVRKYGAFMKVPRCDSVENLENDLKSEYNDFYQDLWSPQAISTAIPLAELIDKITDGEITNAFCLFSLTHRYPLNLKLSPLPIAISFFNYKQLQLKNPGNSEELLHNKKNLPKITYICFSGFYSELDIDVLAEFSESIQIIIIYDAQTGGPVFWDDRNYEASVEELRLKKTDFRSISDKILLLPLDCSVGRINSRNIYDLFEQAIYRSLRKFKPDLVAINHPFNFFSEQENQSLCPFTLKPKIWSKILYEICVAVNYKVMILPYNLISAEQYSKKLEFSKTDQNLTYFVKNVVPRFCQRLKSEPFEEYFLNSVEVMSKIKSYHNHRKASENFGRSSYEYDLFLSKVFSSYQDHPYYSFLYAECSDMILESKAEVHSGYIQKFYETFKLSTPIDTMDLRGYPRELFTEGIKTRRKNKEVINELHSQCTSNRILLFDKEKLENSALKSKRRFIKECLKEYSLNLKDGTPLLPFKNSQYIVDYSNSKLFYFNVLHEGKMSHFEFSLDPSRDTAEGDVSSLDTAPWKENLMNMGLCVGNNKLFIVYGCHFENGTLINSDSIYVYDIIKREWLTPKIQRVNTIKRHSVTCCVFQDQKTEIGYLYVFGGNRDFSSENELNINNIVEFYKIDSLEGELGMKLEHTMIGKSDLYHDKVSYVPYIYSYAFQFKNTNNIFVLGGRKHPLSVYENKTIRYFSYSHTYQRFCPQEAEVKDYRRVLSLRRDAEEKLILADASRNVLQLGESTYILTQNGSRDYCISQVTRAEKPQIYSISHKFQSKYLIEYDPKEAFSQPAYQTETGAMITSINFGQSFINLLRKETPETLMLLQMLAQLIESLYITSGSTHETVIINVCSSVFKDEMFATRNSSGLGSAVLSVLEIVDFLSKDARIVSSAKVIKEKLGIDFERLANENTDAVKEDIRKNLIMSKSRERFIELLNVEIDKAISLGMLSKSVILKLDRVFQRISRDLGHYKPLYSEEFHRWYTYELDKIIGLPEEKLTIFVKQEDTGIIRDLITSLGALWIFLKTFQQIETMVSTTELQKENFWSDTESDKFMPNAKYDAVEFTLDLGLFRGQQERIIRTLKILLLELASRERASLEELGNMSYVDEKAKKWMQISRYTEFNDFLMEKLKDILPLNNEKAQNNANEWIEIYSNEPKIKLNEEKQSHAQPSFIAADAMYEELKSNEIESNTKDLEIEESQTEQKRTQTKTEGKSTRRRASKPSSWVKEAFIPTPSDGGSDITPKLQGTIAYHSIENLLECHSSEALKDYKFFVAPSGSEIHAVFGTNSLRSSLGIYDKETNQFQFIYLDSALHSSLTIWNSAIFLYFDRNLANRHSLVGQQFRDCILYADLRQSFGEDGKTKGVVAFVPMLKNDDALLNRAVIADEQGVFLLGGSRVTSAKKNPIAYSNLCSYYQLEDLKSISAESVKGDMVPMSNKRDNLIVTQNEAHLFVASRYNWNADKSCIWEKNVIEVYNKDEEEWVLTFEVPYDQHALYYTLLRVIRDTKAALLFIANIPGHYPTSFMVDMEEFEELLKTRQAKSPSVRKVGNFEDKTGGVLLCSGLIVFSTQNNYESSKTLEIRSSRREGFENNEFHIIEEF